MASACTGRRCFHSVSRLGSATRTPPSPESSIDGPGGKWSVATILVVVFAAVALAAVLAAVLLLRRRRLQQELLGRSEVVADDAGKPGQGEEGMEEEKWNAGPGAVELVVMAGESNPTYLATPTIQCPPFMIQAKAED